MCDINGKACMVIVWGFRGVFFIYWGCYTLKGNNMWINITTIEEHGSYEVEMNTENGTYRYRQIFGRYYGKWIPGNSPKSANKAMGRPLRDVTI